MSGELSQVRVEGMARFRRTLKQAGGDLNDLRRLHLRIAQLVKPAVEAEAPIGPDKGGHIKTTIRAGATRKAAVIRIGTKAKPYAGPTNYGWPARNIRPNPWAARAVKAAEPIWTEAYFGGITEIVHSIKGK